MKTLRHFCIACLTVVLVACGGGGGGGDRNPPGGGNTAPVARIMANPSSGAAPIVIGLDASSSSDADGSISSYAWDFGDGTSGSGIATSHQYDLPGMYTVSLTVTDNDGASSSTTLVIDITPPLAEVWLGEYQSSLIEPAPLFAELDIAGTAITGSYEDSEGRSGEVSGAINGQAVTLQITATTPGCAGTFTGSGAIDTTTLPGSEVLLFTFTGTDCDGSHTDGSGVLVLQQSEVVAWGQYNPTGLTYRDGELFWTDNSVAPLKKVDTGSGAVTALSSRMVSISSLAVSAAHVVWIDRVGARGTSGCVGNGISRSLMVAAADGSNPRELATGDFCGNAEAPGYAMTDGTYAYWVVADSGTPGRIERVALSGGKPEVLATPGLAFSGMAIDATHLYWSEASIADFSNIYRCPLAGCAGQPAETILTTGDEFTIWRDIQVVGDQLVFGSRRTGEPMYEISVMPKDGGVPLKIADSPGQPLKVLSDGSTVFWLADDMLRSVPLAGGAVTTVVPDFFFVADIAVGNDRVYWADTSFQGGFPDGIYSAAKTGGPISKLVDADSPFRLAVDADGSIVYADSGASGYEPSGIYRVSAAGAVIDANAGLSGQSLLTVDAQNVYAVQGFNIKAVGRDGGSASLIARTDFFVEALDSDGSHVYWLEDPLGVVKRAPVDRSTPPMVLGFNNEKAFDMQVSGNYAYWLGGGDVLSRAPIDGSGPVETLADDLAFAEKLLVDENYVYVIEADAGSLTRMTLTGADRTSIGGTGLNFGWYAMAQDADNIYWAKAGSLNRVAKSGADEEAYPDIVTPDQFAEEWIAVDDEYVYWTEEVFGAIKRIRK